MRHPRKDYDERIQDAAEIIPEDEPVVLLRAQDKLAIPALEYYAQLCEEHQSPEVAKRIRTHIEEMQLWPVKKIPDVPEDV